MRYIKSLIRQFHSLRRGFTLTEVLLAVMIVGLIAIALASLTRAAARESGVGRSRIMLRNNLSTFLRTLRSDMLQSSRVDYVSGAAECGENPVALLQIAQNVDSEGNVIVSVVKSTAEGTMTSSSAKYITYCFVCGTDTENISPSGATRGGAIYRIESGNHYTNGNGACTMLSDDDLLLSNVKYISGDYHVPSFMADSVSRSWTNSLLSVRVITELNSRPVVNDVVEETFAMPMGY